MASETHAIAINCDTIQALPFRYVQPIHNDDISISIETFQ